MLRKFYILLVVIVEDAAICLWIADLDRRSLSRELLVIVTIVVAVVILILLPKVRHFGQMILSRLGKECRSKGRVSVEIFWGMCSEFVFRLASKCET
jgi:predicted signal transduction protein with EAL and GGDEF domain